MANPVRRPAKVMKAVELFHLLDAAQEFSSNSGQAISIQFVFGKQQTAIQLDSKTNLAATIQTWLRATGDDLSVHELKDVQDIFHAERKGLAPVGERMESAIETFNTIAQRWQITSMVMGDAAAKEPYSFRVPVRSEGMELEYSNSWRSLRDYCTTSQMENRDFRINSLYAQMDAYLQDLKSITSRELQAGEHFEELLALAGGLRDLVAQEKAFHADGFITQAGHVSGGLVAFSSVLREAVKAIGESPSMLPQRHVFTVMADALDKGDIPDSAALSKAWEDGENKAVNLGAFRSNFLGAVADARKNPETLFSTIRATAKLANDKINRHISIDFQSEFGQLKHLTGALHLRYMMRNDDSLKMKQFADQLESLQAMLAKASRADFNPQAADNKHFYANLFSKAQGAEQSYKALLSDRELRLNESYAEYAESGVDGKMQWLAETVDEIREWHPVFSVTRIPSVFHRAVLRVMDKLQLDAVAHGEETPKERFLREQAHDLVTYLHTGDIIASDIFDSTAEDKMTYFCDLNTRMAHADSGHDGLMREEVTPPANFTQGDAILQLELPVEEAASMDQGVHNSAEVVTRGAAVMQPDGFDAVPTPHVVAGEFTEIDRIIAEGAQDLGIKRGSAALGLDDAAHESHTGKITPGGKGSTHLHRLEISNAFGYDEPTR